MKKILIAFALLTVLLTVPTVAGAAEADVLEEDILTVEESMDNFTEVRSYENQFADVPADAWYVSAAARAYSYGLIDGESQDCFNPDGSLSVAAAITMVDRVHSIYYTGTRDFAGCEPWYASYVDYALENGILSEAPADFGDAITRARFASLLARALPEEALPAVSEIEDNSIPDVASDSPYYVDFYLLYRAGVLTGSDELGSAWPDDPITRAEAAAVLARMADRSERRSIALAAAVTMYALDGSTLTVFANEVKANEADGWYRYPVTMVYTFNDESKVIPASEEDAWLEADWYRYPVTKIYALDGESKVIPTGEKDGWLEAGWYAYPVMTIYALGGESRVIPVSEKSDWMKAGWYAQPIVPLPPNFNQTTTLPVISISTGGASISRTEAYTSCTVSVFNVGGEQALSNVTGGIRVRGNSSRAANPPPYRIKFDQKQNMLGLNDGAETKSWVLLTNVDGAVDGMRNDIAFRLGRTLLEPDGYYCSDAKFVHVYLNGSFWGVYLLCEQNQVQKNRVSVYEPEEGYTGTDIGYLVELDNYSEKPYFTMNYGYATVRDVNGTTGTFRYHTYSVKSDTYDQSQVDFIAKYTRGAFQIVYEACEKGNYLTFDQDYNVVPSSYQSAKEAVEAVIDVRSFVDMYILYEIMHDYDVGGGSFFLCVDFSAESKYTKLTCTAPWDFNWTCTGNVEKYFAGTWNIPSTKLGDRTNPWFVVLYKQGWFQELIKEKWAEVGGSAGLHACVEEEIAILDANKADINRKISGSVSSGKVYLNWITRRLNWLDSVWTN